MPTNLAAAVRGPRHIVRRGKTPVLDPAEARQLIDKIDTSTVIGLRDRALIGLMVYSFARIGAAIGMRASRTYSRRIIDLKNGGTLEEAAQMANHASTRTTQLYDRRAEEVTLDEVERILV